MCQLAALADCQRLQPAPGPGLCPWTGAVPLDRGCTPGPGLCPWTGVLPWTKALPPWPRPYLIRDLVAQLVVCKVSSNNTSQHLCYKDILPSEEGLQVHHIPEDKGCGEGVQSVFSTARGFGGISTEGPSPLSIEISYLVNRNLGLQSCSMGSRKTCLVLWSDFNVNKNILMWIINKHLIL